MKRGYLITIGSFDGVHLGHQALLARTCSEAQKRGLKTLALTFSIPPKMILDAAQPLRLLSDLREKEVLLKKFGIDKVLFWKFTKQTSTMRPFAFLKEVLVGKLKARGVVVGADFRFGSDRSAGAHELVRWAQQFEIPVWVIAPVKRNRHVVSSSLIRPLLENHHVRKAAGFLGHPYLIGGRVVRGQRLGEKLGFPTANIEPAVGKIVPRGVFAVRAWVEGQPQRVYDGVCNIGVRPTVANDNRVIVETHLFHNPKKITGRFLFVELHAFLRPEKKFSSVSALVQQIGSDVKKAQKTLKKLQLVHHPLKRI